MSCSNCYNGCTEIISDKCVKYTGIDVPVLGIQNGDSLSYVEQALIEFLTSTLDGSGIKIDLDPATLCEFVSDRLPSCGDITLVNILDALTSAVCFLKDEVIALEAKFSELEQGYTIDCLDGSPDPTSTYAVLQATIVKVCQLEADILALALDLDVNYVRLDELNSLIDAYINETGISTKLYTKMVPFTVVEYYGSLSNFDASGAGIGDWEKIYLCNGQNTTPDKRGRSPIGVIQGVGGGALDEEVKPSNPGNTDYVIRQKNGVNTITLSTLQIPSHTHVGSAISTSTVSPNPHDHGWTGVGGTGNPDGSLDNITAGNIASYPRQSQQKTVSLTVSTSTNVTINEQGGGGSHNNVHPVLACYYIMYIPS